MPGRDSEINAGSSTDAGTAQLCDRPPTWTRSMKQARDRAPAKARAKPTASRRVRPPAAFPAAANCASPPDEGAQASIQDSAEKVPAPSDACARAPMTMAAPVSMSASACHSPCGIGVLHVEGASGEQTVGGLGQQSVSMSYLLDTAPLPLHPCRT